CGRLGTPTVGLGAGVGGLARSKTGLQEVLVVGELDGVLGEKGGRPSLVARSSRPDIPTARSSPSSGVRSTIDT
ncbi:MAG: hypothetical protein M3179_00805, partial [Actinomycetota bacterium]|nr:hypothetical protein [Actinomycetota bacterium]